MKDGAEDVAVVALDFHRSIEGFVVEGLQNLLAASDDCAEGGHHLRGVVGAVGGELAGAVAHEGVVAETGADP